MLKEVRREPDKGERYQALQLVTTRGEIAVRYYPSPNPRFAALMVGGAGGGWDTPARDLYPRLAELLEPQHIGSLRVRFRDPHDLRESVHDVLAGLVYLEDQGVERVALVGHSFGGAVVIQAGVLSPTVASVVTLATQSYGTDNVDRLPPRSLLLLHGGRDTVLPASASEAVFAHAREPKRLVIYPGAGHMLDEVADPVTDEVCGQIEMALTGVA